MPTKRKFPDRHRLFAVAFWLFRRPLEPEKIKEELLRLDEDDPKFSRIRCPLCKWRPTASSSWHCGDCAEPEFFFDGCGTVWNTFDTGGRCPGCKHQWRWTSCLRCEEWSRHEDWYAKDDD